MNKLALTTVAACIAATASLSTAFAATPSWMKIDTAHKTVRATITMAQGGNNGTLNFNGYAHGALTLTVPKGWHVAMHVINGGGMGIPHSLEVIKTSEVIPAQGVEPPAFPQAETVNLIQGLEAGQSDDVTFDATTNGRYWIFCGVPNHGVGGMWDYFVVSPKVTTPTVTYTH
jgi:sulfocyanin